jgi:hypothetical protein
MAFQVSNCRVMGLGRPAAATCCSCTPRAHLGHTPDGLQGGHHHQLLNGAPDGCHRCTLQVFSSARACLGCGARVDTGAAVHFSDSSGVQHSLNQSMKQLWDSQAHHQLQVVAHSSAAAALKCVEDGCKT